MPKLPTFTAKAESGVISGGRMATAEDLSGGDLSTIGATVRKAASTYLADAEENESRTVLVKQAEIRAKYAKRLDEAAINGEDIGKIREELDSELSTVSEGLVTRKGADTAALHSANTGAIFDNQANQIAVTRAVAEARVAGASFLNSTGAIIAANPSYLPQAEKDVDAFTATLTRVPPEKRAAMAADLKQNMNVAAAMANARLDPEGTLNAVKGGAYNMTPEQRGQVIHQAEATVRANRAEAAYTRAEAQYQEHKADEKARDSHFKNIMAGTATARQILDDPSLMPATREHLVTFMEQRTKALAGQEKKSDPAAVRDLWLRINAPDGSPNKIYNGDAIFEAVNSGKVNTTDANQLNSLVANQRDVNGRGFAQRLGGRMQTVIGAMRNDVVLQQQPELAASIQMEIISRVEKRSDEMRKAGQSPDALLDPESKDYFFKPGTLKSIANDVQARARELAPQHVDLRTTPEAVGTVEIGQTFIDPKGVTRVMSKELKAKLGSGAPAAAAPQDDFAGWMKATGGVLKPGQTQAQAIAEWKAGR